MIIGEDAEAIFRGNVAAKGPGAILLDDGSKFLAEPAAGAVIFHRNRVETPNMTLATRTAAASSGGSTDSAGGGAVAVAVSGKFHVNSANFTDNVALSDTGGAIAVIAGSDGSDGRFGECVDILLQVDKASHNDMLILTIPDSPLFSDSETEVNKKLTEWCVPW